MPKNFTGLNGLMSSTISSVNSGGSLLFLFFLLAIFLLALSFGKTRILLALMASYMAVFLESIFFYQMELAKRLGDWLKLPAVSWTHFLVFAVFFILSFFILNRSILRPKMSLQESPPIAILFLSILLGIFWLTIIYSYLPARNTFLVINSAMDHYLRSTDARFVWASAPLLALLFLKRKKTSVL